MRHVFMIGGIVILYGTSIGQTVHIDNFDCFVGCFEQGNGIDCSEFIEWQFVRPDSDGYRRVQNKIESNREKHWVYDWEPLTNQSKIPGGGKYRQNSRGFEYYILMDLFGHERQRNVLTIWERVGRDSLRFHCGQTGIFDSFIGSSRIEKVRTFPDSSTLLVVKTGGEGYSGYKFYRGTPECDFQIFYEKRWRVPADEGEYDYTNIHYNFEYLRRLHYKATEVSEFITVKHSDMDFQISVDSANVRIIDLWDMAQKTLGLD